MSSPPQEFESQHTAQPAVTGKNQSPNGLGVLGIADYGPAIVGKSANIAGVVGESEHGEGVRGLSHNKKHGGVVGICDAADGGTGVYGQCKPGGNAGAFDGNVFVRGELSVTAPIRGPAMDRVLERLEKLEQGARDHQWKGFVPEETMP